MQKILRVRIDSISLYSETLSEKAISTRQSFDVLEASEAICHPVFKSAERVTDMSFRRESIFSDHLLQTQHSDFIPVFQNSNIWLFGLLFIAFILYAWVISFNSKRILQLMRALFSNRGFSRFTREGNLFGEALFFPLVLMVISCLSLFAFRINWTFDFFDFAEQSSIKLYVRILVGVGLFYLVKVLIVKISAWIFKEQDAAELYLTNIFIFNTAITFIFLPLLLIAFFSEPWIQDYVLYLMLGLFFINLIWRAFRSFSITNSVTNFSYFHNFLYLCTLEIGYPLLVVSLLILI